MESSHWDTSGGGKKNGGGKWMKKEETNLGEGPGGRGVKNLPVTKPDQISQLTRVSHNS